MTVWRLEWARLWRTRRAIALAAVFLLFGLTGPLLARYAAQLVRYAGPGVRIDVPAPVPVDGVTNYVKNAVQVGLLVVVVVAAGALTFDARRGLATFYRTRVHPPALLVLPRYAVNASAAVAAYALGTLAMWYETIVLLGALPVAGVVLGAACMAAYLAFAVAVVAAAAALARGVLATVGIALGALVVLPVAGTLPSLERWLPSALVGAPAALAGDGRVTTYLPALAVSSAATVALLALAVARTARREL